MKRHLIIFTCLLLTNVLLQAQISFEKTFGTANSDYGKAVAPTYDGGYVVGASYDGLPCIIKTNALGDTTWLRTYSFLTDTGYTYLLNSITQTSDSNYVLVGYSSYNQSGYMMKINRFGDTLWVKYGINTPTKIVEDRSDNLIMIGEGYSPNATCCYPFITKADPDGSIISSFTPPIYCPSSVGCRFQEIFVDNDGNYLVSGDAPYPNTPVLRLTKINENGTVLWNKIYQGISASVQSICQSPDNGYLLVGNYWSQTDSTFVFKTDYDGNLEWTKKYKTNNTFWQGKSIAKVNDGYFIAGNNGRIFLMKIDLAYNLEWSFDFFTSSSVSEIKSTTDNGAIIVGTKYISSVADIYLIKIGPNGELVGEMDDHQPNKFIIAPNPTDGQFTIRTLSETLDNTQLYIYDILGNHILTTSINRKTTIDLRKEKAGIYFIVMVDNDGHLIEKKVIKN